MLAIPDGPPSEAKHIALDFLEEPEVLAKVLKEKDIEATIFSFTATCMQGSKKIEVCRVMLRRCVEWTVPWAAIHTEHHPNLARSPIHPFTMQLCMAT